MKLTVIFLCFCMVSPLISEEINLSLDFELNEPENIIFNLLIDIATDSNNNIYVLDNKEKVIYLFNEAGIYRKSIGRAGQGPGEFQRPVSIYIDPKDTIYILDTRNRRVEIFDSEANYVRSIKFTEFPTAGNESIIADKNGNLYISGYYRNANSVLAKYSSTGELLKRFPLPIMEYRGVNFTEFNKQMVRLYLTGGTMCFDEEDGLIFSYTWPYVIKSFSSEGEERFQFSINDNLNWRPYIFEMEPDGILFDDSTGTRKIFLYDNKYLVNSIYSVDWTGNPKKKISQKDVPKNLEKYVTVKRKFALLDFYTKDGKRIGSAEIDGKIYFKSVDSEGRILGIKYDEEGKQTIVRYKTEIIQE
ncbi:MAG: NHL repeat-containing protein [Candidatus Aminicenantes bacterium]|nr:NHL repeat-containing protein [Candidatus Aminicenantes bacterium]